jgi:dephospho-CoA kinase
LFEVGREVDFDAVIVTAVDPETQVRRVMDRDGATETEARQRLAAQLPIADKVARADYVIRTDGTFDETKAQVRDVLAQIEADASRRY